MRAQAIGAVGAFCCVLLASHAFARAPSSCPLPGQKNMAIAQLFFGLSVPGRGPVTLEEWRRFASSTLTRYFRDGFTAYDASGQWMDPKTGHIARERSKVVVVVASDDAQFAKNIASVADSYRAQFHQQSVGVVTQTACAAF